MTKYLFPRLALTELCVLSDIFNLYQHKKYIILDPVQADPPEPRPAATLIYKKKVRLAELATKTRAAIYKENAVS
jgi:hypothetical protein